MLLHAAIRVVDAAVQHERRRALFEQRGRYLPEQGDRIVIECAPQRRVERPEEARGVVIPAPPHVARERIQPLVCGCDKLPQRARLAYDRGELRSCHREHTDRIGAECARLGRLDDEYALQQSLVDERDPEKRVIRVFAGLAEIFEPRMGRRVFHDQRRQRLANQTGKPLRQSHAHAPDAVGAQADGRGQHERRSIGLEKIDRAHVGIERALNQLDDVAQRLFGMSAVRNEMADFFEGPEERVALCRHAAEHSRMEGGISDFTQQHCSFLQGDDISVHEVSGPLLP